MEHSWRAATFTPGHVMPRSRLKELLRDLPTTNFRIFVSVCLAIVYVAVHLLLPIVTVAFGRDPIAIPRDVSLAIGPLLVAMMGLDAVQFAVKRRTYIPSPPGEPDIEDTATRAGVRIPDHASGTVPQGAALTRDSAADGQIRDSAALAERYGDERDE